MWRPLEAMPHMISDKASHAFRIRSLHMDCSLRAEQSLGQYRDDNFHPGLACVGPHSVPGLVPGFQGGGPKAPDAGSTGFIRLAGPRQLPEWRSSALSRLHNARLIKVQLLASRLKTSAWCGIFSAASAPIDSSCILEFIKSR